MLSSSSGFLPYSTSFLQELESSTGVGEEADDPITPSSSSSKKQKRKPSNNNNTIKIVNSLDCINSSSSSFKSVVLSDDGLTYAIATTENNAALFFSGFGNITLLKGSMNINGYDVDIGKEMIIKRSSWLPAIRLWCNDTMIHSFQTVDGCSYQSKKPGPVKLSTLSKQAKEKLNALNLNGIKCCFILQGLKIEDQEWMIRIEDKSMYTCAAASASPNASSWNSSTDVVSCSTGLLGNMSYFTSINGDVMSLPPSWVSTVDSITTENTMTRNQLPSGFAPSSSSAKMNKNQNQSQKQSVKQSSNLESSVPIVSMVCGAKGAGKSSYMKYLVNRLLSYSKTIMGSEFAQVCVIDCDLGQPELTMPGMVSLNVVTSPLVSSSHLHMQSPAASVFLGDITSRYEPEAFCTAMKKLHQHYLMIQEAYIQRIQQQLASNTQQSTKSSLPTSTSLGSNMFSLLHDEPEQSSKITTTSTKKVNIISESSTDATWRIPLIINTDGNVQYMGAEILSAIADIFQPSHIMHLASLRSRPLPIFEVLRRRANASNQNEWGMPVAVTGHSSCRFMNVERGREGPSKVSPIDLRNIRMISYFLRNVNIRLPSNIIPKAKKLETSASTASLTALSTAPMDLDDIRGDEDDEVVVINDDDNRGRDLDAFYIKNAKFVGAEQCGALAFGMLERCSGGQEGLAHYLVPFDRVVFNDNRDEISDFYSFTSYNILAAINGELVGLSVYDEDLHGSIPLITTTMRQCGSTSDPLQLRSFEHFQIMDCIGIVLVRAIDVQRRCIVLTAPSTIRLRPGRIILTTGVSLTLPNAAYIGSGFPTYPYSVSELCGEGSVQSKVRSSVKRKINGN